MSWLATAEALRMVELALFCPTLGECERRGRCLLFPLARAWQRRCPILDRPRNPGCSILHILQLKDVLFIHSHVARRQRSKSPPIGRLPARFLMCSQWTTVPQTAFPSWRSLAEVRGGVSDRGCSPLLLEPSLAEQVDALPFRSEASFIVRMVGGPATGPMFNYGHSAVSRCPEPLAMSSLRRNFAESLIV